MRKILIVIAMLIAACYFWLAGWYAKEYFDGK